MTSRRTCEGSVEIHVDRRSLVGSRTGSPRGHIKPRGFGLLKRRQQRCSWSCASEVLAKGPPHDLRHRHAISVGTGTQRDRPRSACISAAGLGRGGRGRQLPRRRVPVAPRFHRNRTAWSEVRRVASHRPARTARCRRRLAGCPHRVGRPRGPRRRRGRRRLPHGPCRGDAGRTTTAVALRRSAGR